MSADRTCIRSVFDRDARRLLERVERRWGWAGSMSGDMMQRAARGGDTNDKRHKEPERVHLLGIQRSERSTLLSH